MSSSLFDSGVSYQYYPETSYTEGDKTFAELDKNDIIYYCTDFGEIYGIKVKDKLKKKQGKIVLPLEKNFLDTKFIVIGQINDFNASNNANNCSIVEYNMGAIGTNRISVIMYCLNRALVNFEATQKEVTRQKQNLNKLRNLL